MGSKPSAPITAPVDMGVGVVNTVKGGSTVPLKFEVYQGGVELTDPAAVSADLEDAEDERVLLDRRHDDRRSNARGILQAEIAAIDCHTLGTGAL